MLLLTCTLAHIFIQMMRRELRKMRIFLFMGRIVEWKLRKSLVILLLRKRETIIKTQVKIIS